MYIKPKYGGPKALVFLVLIRVVSSKYIILFPNILFYDRHLYFTVESPSNSSLFALAGATEMLLLSATFCIDPLS